MTTSQLTVDLLFLSSDVDCCLTVIYVVAFNCLLLGHDGFCFCFTFVPVVERAYRYRYVRYFKLYVRGSVQVD
jgi:hypothetical protein